MAKKTEGAVIILSATEEDILTVIWGHAQGVYGLDILNRINKANKETNRREIGVGSLYPALKRMEQQGLMSGRWGEEALGEESGGARRRYYKISADGEKALIVTRNYRRQLSFGQTIPAFVITILYWCKSIRYSVRVFVLSFDTKYHEPS
jgi:PadR family transcriptional regulator, regulatory protein PadR